MNLMKLTTRQQIAHLMRRFAFGASELELNHLEPLGVQGALDHLLNYESQDEGFGISPWEFCREPDKDEVYVDGYRFASWWSLRLVMSQRPVEQKLTLFWHNHFAVGGDKVEFGPMLYTYLETLRVNAMGNFPTLLKAISRDPAMLHYLDGDTSVRNSPNENFARELFELFTVGKGNYSEDDIKETARVFTGWGNRYLLYEDPQMEFQAKLKDCIARNLPMVTSSFSPELSDDGPKKVFGKVANYNADSLLEMLALRPQTAALITGKMWQFFAGTKLPNALAAKLINLFLKTNGNTKAVLKEIANSPEFWTEQCVRKQVKSPADFTVSILRQLGLYPILKGLHPVSSSNSSSIPKPLRDAAGMLWGTMFKQGMALLFPPNVSGWPMGKAWITPNNMLVRAQFADLLFGVGQPEQPLAGFVAKQILDTNPLTSYNSIIKFLTIFDADLPPVKQYILIQAFDKHGGLASLKTPSGASKTLGEVARLLFSTPEFQLG